MNYKRGPVGLERAFLGPLWCRGGANVITEHRPLEFAGGPRVLPSKVMRWCSSRVPPRPARSWAAGVFLGRRPKNSVDALRRNTSQAFSVHKGEGCGAAKGRAVTRDLPSGSGSAATRGLWKIESLSWVARVSACHCVHSHTRSH